MTLDKVTLDLAAQRLEEAERTRVACRCWRVLHRAVRKRVNANCSTPSPLFVMEFLLNGLGHCASPPPN